MLQAGTTTFPAKWVRGSVNLAQSGGRRVELSIHWVEASQSQTRESEGHHNHNQPTAHRTHREGGRLSIQWVRAFNHNLCRGRGGGAFGT